MRLTGHASISPSVIGNGTELNRALTNLIANAVRHTHEGGVVDVALTEAGDQLSITVADQCGGIPPADLPRVFDVGFRGETARTQRQNDHARGGLGLAITKGIVEAHDGTIDVRNTEDGCVFQVLLPAQHSARV